MRGDIKNKIIERGKISFSKINTMCKTTIILFNYLKNGLSKNLSISRGLTLSEHKIQIFLWVHNNMDVV